MSNVNKFFCPDCGKQIWVGSTRCKSCSKKGIRNNSYKEGRCCKVYNCRDCGIEIDPMGRSIRCPQCYFKINKGKNHGSWLGGISKLPYAFEFTFKLKEKIRNRDGYKCQKCGIKEENHYRKLDIHHIDYNKKNCKRHNLITLCQSCHSKAGVNRDYWFAYFTYIMERE